MSLIRSSRVPKGSLQVFVAKVTGAVLFGISTVSSVLAFLDVIDAKYLIVAAIALVGLCGWAAAFYVSRSERAGKTAGELLLRNVCRRLPIAYLETWLRSTLLNETALGVYWHVDKSLAVSKICCRTTLTSNDAKLAILFEGSNASRGLVESCPMIMFGGSVIHLKNFKQKAVSIAADGDETDLHIREVLDLGQLHCIDMIFRMPVGRQETFAVEHRHEWPGGMTDGEDTLWYPYAALFEREPSSMSITVTFESAPTYILGVRASLKSGSCATAEQQPRMVGGEGRDFEWSIDPVDNDCIYGLVFKRLDGRSSY